jgi:hypothetical protein
MITNGEPRTKSVRDEARITAAGKCMLVNEEGSVGEELRHQGSTHPAFILPRLLPLIGTGLLIAHKRVVAHPWPDSGQEWTGTSAS